MSSNMFVSGFSPPYMLRVSTKTWMRDSHDLFDYETSQQVNVSHFAASCALKLLRSDADVSAIEYSNPVDREHDHLLNVVCKRTGEYVVMPAEKVPGSLLYPQKLWLIVRTLPYQRYALQENDIIKLGRFRLRVKQLVPGPVSEDTGGAVTLPNPPGASEPALDEAQIVKLFDGVIPEKNVSFDEQCNMQCRICLAEGYLNNPVLSSDTSPLNSSKDTSLDMDTMSTHANASNGNASVTGAEVTDQPEIVDSPPAGSFDADRLICACECKGSIKYVHVDCLRKWIDSRWNLKADEPLPSMVFIREVACELCKTNYPCYIRQNGELIQIVKMPKMSVPFLVLENITPHAVKGVHLLSMKDMKDLKLGRGHESDVRIPDVSISRYHATIRYEAGQFYLEDHDSKFGTLVAMRKPKLVSLNEPLSVQVGRSVIHLSIDESLPFLHNRLVTLSSSNFNGDGQVVGTNSEAQRPGPNVRDEATETTGNPAPAGAMAPTASPPIHTVAPSSAGVANLASIANSAAMRMGIDVLDHPINSSRYLSFLQSAYSNAMVVSPRHSLESCHTPTNFGNASSMSANSGGPGLASNPHMLATPTNFMSYNLPHSNSSSSGPASANAAAGSSAGPLPGGANFPPSVPVQTGLGPTGITDLYWSYMRNATRSRMDSDALDGLSSRRVNSFRMPGASNSSSASAMACDSPPAHSLGAHPPTLASQHSAHAPGCPRVVGNQEEELEMLLPESVFIANWSSLPTRNVDLGASGGGGDTSTSGLEHGHSSQELDKPMSRM